MSSILADELDFVGNRKRLAWFNSSLANNPWLVRMVDEIVSRRQGTSVRNILYGLFPLSEYLADQASYGTTLFGTEAMWLAFAVPNERALIELSVRYGTQGNIPQRAAIISDYALRKGLLHGEATQVVELGCSAGLLGRFLCHQQLLLSSAALMQRYFWLKRLPLRKQNHTFNYTGVDVAIPPDDLVPYFVQDHEKRAKTKLFVREVLSGGELVVDALEDYLLRIGSMRTSDIMLLVTAFVLYHFEQPESAINVLLDVVHAHHNIHWLDLSRNAGLNTLYRDYERHLVPNYVYLSDNGVPVAQIVNGSDDCPNWKYL
jgi:hypothetical protein